MSAEVSLLNELRNRCLVESGTVIVSYGFGSYESFNQFWWDDKVTQAQRWEQDFAEGTEQDYRAGFIHTLQSRHRAIEVAELAVVIILDDPGTGSCSPFQKLRPTLRAHGRSKWLYW